MTTANIFTMGLVLGIAAISIWFGLQYRRQILNIALLGVGAALLAYGHVQWWARHESPEIKEAMFIRHVVAGWALTGMGFIGIQCGRGGGKDGDS